MLRRGSAAAIPGLMYRIMPLDSTADSLTLDFDASTMALQEIVSTIQTMTRTVGVFHWTGSTWVAPGSAASATGGFITLKHF